MVFCQSCGARNTDDSQFCNMCGAKIASSGEPGGPVGGAANHPATAPMHAPSGSSASGTSSTMSGSSVSLSAIGVRSPARTYGIMIAAGVLLFTLGAGGMWLAMRPSETAPVAELGEGEGEEPIDLGEQLLPEGEEIPSEGALGPDTARPTTPTKRPSTGGTRPGGSSAGSGGTSTGTGGASAGTGGSSASTGSGTGAGTGATTGSGTGTTGSGSTTGSGTGTTGSGSTTGSGTGTTGSGSTTGSGTGTTGSETEGTTDPTPPATGGTGAPVDWDRAGGGGSGQSEEDVLLDAYANHVRSYIREYYLRRAQACFDHETRVDQASVRGRVVIGFTILGSGSVSGSTVDSNSTGLDSLGSCLQRQVAGWRLPRPPEGIDELPMQMPFSR